MMGAATVTAVGNGVEVKARTEKRRLDKHRKRARQAGVRSDLSSIEWMLLLIRFGFRCAYCERPFETLDHIVPVSNGGGTTYVNVVPCCMDCNRLKGTAVWL